MYRRGEVGVSAREPKEHVTFGAVNVQRLGKGAREEGRAAWDRAAPACTSLTHVHC